MSDEYGAFSSGQRAAKESKTPLTPNEICPWREVVFIAGLALILNLVGNGAIPLWDRDEPRYGGCAREMLESGDYLHPTFNAQPRYHKPILIYWLMQPGLWIGGDNPFGARMASAVAGMGTCLLVWWLGRWMLGWRTGYWSAFLLAVTPFMVVESKLATTDATLTFFTVLCWFAIWMLHQKSSAIWAAVFWIAAALGVLTKGPVTPVFLIASGLVAWWLGGSIEGWKRLRWGWGVPLFLAIAAPWFIMIGIDSQGEYYNVSVGYHVIRRATEGIEQHGGFPGYYVLFSAGLLFPWSILLLPSLLAAWETDRTRPTKLIIEPGQPKPLLRVRIWHKLKNVMRKRQMDPNAAFLLGWVLGPLLVLEIARTKLIHYYLPSVPGWALLTGVCLVGLMRRRGALSDLPHGKWSIVCLRWVSVAIALGLMVSPFALGFPPELVPPMWAMAFVIAIAAFWSRWAFVARRPMQAALVLAFSWATVLLILAGSFLPTAAPSLISHRVGERLAELHQETGVEPLIASFHPPGVVYAHKHPIAEMSKYPEIREFITQKGAALIPMIHEEEELCRKRKDFILGKPLDTMTGFDLTKGKKITLRFFVVKLRPPGQPDESEEDQDKMY